MHVTRIGEEGNVQLEDYGLVLFISLRYNLFCELDDRFKVGVMIFLRLRQTSTMVNCKMVGAEGRGAKEKEKAPTFGAKGFRLESAMKYDGDG
jgi:hypothetical protein